MHYLNIPKYYQNNKESLEKKLLKDIKSFLKKKNKNVTILSWTIQKSTRRWKQKLVEYRKKHYKMKKTYIYNYKKLLFKK